MVLPAFNAARTIRAAIESIRCQTVTDIRIIAIDDGSTDGTRAILDELAAAEPRLLVLAKPNSGITETVTLGLRHCTADLIARHDADDLSEPDRFAKEIAYLDSHPNCVAVSGDSWHIDQDGTRSGSIARHQPPGLADTEWIPAKEPHLTQPFLMMRRASLLQVGGYRAFAVAEDSDLYWRLQEIGDLHNISEIVGSYRIHAGSISSTSIRNGRMAALWSQLAALSARRRRSGRPDLRFAQSDADAYRGAWTIWDFYRLGCRQLDAEERRRLHISMAAKLVEVSFYRPFEPERSDCSFIRKAVGAHADLLGATNREQLLDAIMRTALRLATGGRILEAFSLFPLKGYPAFMGRLTFRIGLPDPLRTLIKRSLGRARAA